MRKARRRVALIALALLAVTPFPALTADASPPHHHDTEKFAVAIPFPPQIDLPSHVSAVLLEAATGQVILAQRGAERRPIASAIKLVTALVTVDALPTETVVAVGDDIRGVEGSSFGLRPGQSRTVRELLIGLLLRSGNDAAVALAVAVAETEEAFVGRMVDYLSGLGIDAHVGSSSGLSQEDALSALELGTVARAALQDPEIRSLVGSRTIETGESEIENRNFFLRDIEGATGLKTGFTSAAGFTLAASAVRDGRELIAVVLGAEGDLERRRIAMDLLEFGFSQTRPVQIESSLQFRTTAGPVLLAVEADSITVHTGATIAFAWPKSAGPSSDLREVTMLVDGVAVGQAPIRRLGGQDAPPRSSLGRALANGAYAALRVPALADVHLTDLR